METIFMNCENSKTSETRRFRLNLAGKLNLKDPKKNMALADLSIWYTWKSIKSEYNNSKFEITAVTWHDALIYQIVLLLLQIQDYFRFIIKKQETLTGNPQVQIYPNKIKNRISFRIKTGYKLELLTLGTMKLSGSTKKDVDKDFTIFFNDDEHC